MQTTTRRRYVTVPAAARVLGISANTMHELLDGGAIPYTVPLKQKRVLYSDVLEYRAAREYGQRTWIEQVPGHDPLLD